MSTKSLRLEKVRNFWKKKFTRRSTKFRWNGRREVSIKRLRIGGRFVTKEQAFKILGIEQQDFLDN